MLKAESDSATKIKSLYELYQLSELIKEATRVTMTTSSLTDHIVTNTPKKISVFGVIHTSINNHSLVFAIRKISVTKNRENIVEIRHMKNFDNQNLLRIRCINIGRTCISLLKIQIQSGKFGKKLFLEVLNRHAPLQHKKIRAKRIPWLTSPIKERINTRDKLKRKAIITNLEYDWENYKTIPRGLLMKEAIPKRLGKL